MKEAAKDNDVFMFNDFSLGLNMLENALLSEAPYILLRGKSGSGKTTLLRELFKRTDCKHFKVLYLAHGQPTPDTIIRLLAEEFHIPLRRSRAETGRYLVQTMRYRSERVVLWIDEAQSLPENTFQEIRFLAESELNEKPIFSVLFSALPEIKDRLQYPNLYPLWRRINPKVTLGGLLHEEVAHYIKHLFPNEKVERFSSEAIAAIFEKADGIPSQIKSITQHCLGCFKDGPIGVEQALRVADNMELAD